MSRESVFEEIHQERDRQDMKWGEQNHPILPDYPSRKAMKNAADQARELCNNKFKEGKPSWYYVLLEEFCEAFAEDEAMKQRYELVQVAAVAISMIECIDRKLKP